MFCRRFPLLLVPDRIGAGLEIDRTACVFPPFQNVNHHVGIPMVGISGSRDWSLDADLPLICGGIQNLFLLQELGDLHRPRPSMHSLKIRLTTIAATSSTIHFVLSSGSLR